MKTREQFIEQVRAEHEDWTDDQVAAEADRLYAAQEKENPDPDPDPKKGDRDAAMARLRREKQEAERREKEARDALAAKERKEAEQAGEWEKLAKQYEQERDDARGELARLKRRIDVEKIARRLKFRHADEAIALLPADLDDADDGKVEQALAQLAADRPHLINSGAPGPTGGPPGPAPTGLTYEQVKAMSQEEINERWDEVAPVLEAHKG